MKAGAKTIIRKLMDEVRKLRDENARFAGSSESDVSARDAIADAQRFLARKPAKRMETKRAKAEAPQRAAHREEQGVFCYCGQDQAVSFRGDSGRELFHATLIGARLRIFSPASKIVVMPEDGSCVEIANFVDSGAVRARLDFGTTKAREPQGKGGQMSASASCQCPEKTRRENWVVIQRNCNHSAFNGYHQTRSDYSGIHCKKCLRFWRTKAGYVSALPSGKL